MKLYNGTATIQTLNFGEINIVKFENRHHYISLDNLDLIEANDGEYYEIMKSCNGYLVAVHLTN